MSVKKKRINLTLTRPYLDALDQLVEKGLYLDPQTVIRAALRVLFTSYRIPPFDPLEAEPEPEPEIESEESKSEEEAEG